MILFIKTLYFTLQEFLISKVTLIRPVRINIFTGYLSITLQYSPEQYDILDSVVTLKTYIEPFSDLNSILDTMKRQRDREREREREREDHPIQTYHKSISSIYY
jgi:hypothetical protein